MHSNQHIDLATDEQNCKPHDLIRAVKSALGSGVVVDQPDHFAALCYVDNLRIRIDIELRSDSECCVIFLRLPLNRFSDTQQWQAHLPYWSLHPIIQWTAYREDPAICIDWPLRGEDVGLIAEAAEILALHRDALQNLMRGRIAVVELGQRYRAWGIPSISSVLMYGFNVSAMARYCLGITWQHFPLVLVHQRLREMRDINTHNCFHARLAQAMLHYWPFLEPYDQTIRSQLRDMPLGNAKIQQSRPFQMSPLAEIYFALANGQRSLGHQESLCVQAQHLEYMCLELLDSLSQEHACKPICMADILTAWPCGAITDHEPT